MKIGRIFLSVMGLLTRGLITVVALILIYRLGFQAYDFGYRVFSEPPVTNYGDGVELVVVVPMGAGAFEIGRTLERTGLIRDAKLLVAQELLSEYHGKLQPGTYKFSTSMTADEMIEKMAAGETMDSEEESGEVSSNSIVSENVGAQIDSQ